MSGQLYPTAFNQTIGSTDRLELLNNPAMRGGILMNLDSHLFIANSMMTETIPKGHMFKEYIRHSNIGSEIHDVGDEILGMDTKRRKIRVFIDDRPRVSKATFDDIEEFLSDMSAQQKTAERMGVEHAEHIEIYALKLLILASRETTTDADFPGGGFDNNGAAVSLGTGNVATLAGTVLTKLDEIDEHWFDIRMNNTNRTVALDSGIWYALRDRDDVFPGTMPFYHRDMITGASPSPDQLAGLDAELRYKGFRIIRSQLANRVFGQDLSTDRYQPGDFSSTLGVVYAPEAAVLIRTMGVAVEAYRSPQFLANHIQSMMMLGGGSLYAEQSIELTGTIS